MNRLGLGLGGIGALVAAYVWGFWHGLSTGHDAGMLEAQRTGARRVPPR